MSSNSEFDIEKTVQAMKGGDADAWVSYLRHEYPNQFEDVVVEEVFDPDTVTHTNPYLTTKRYAFVPKELVGKFHTSKNRVATLSVTSQPGRINSAECELITDNGYLLVNPTSDQISIASGGSTRTDRSHGVVEFKKFSAGSLFE